MTDAARQHVLIRVFGQVQGVFFRVTAKARADELSVTGFAKNEEDGSVTIAAEGTETQLLIFIDWCKKGPPLAIVEKVVLAWKKHVDGYRVFEIL